MNHSRINMNVLGLDIGGANIKASDADGRTASMVFPMWTRHRELASVLQAWTQQELTNVGILNTDMIALTMTAELADCFQTKQEGVQFVIDAVREAFPQQRLQVWMTSGEFAEADDAIALANLVAASNWHALATWAGRAVPKGPAMLIDVGSTTTDIIPLLDGYPISKGLNDFERLCAGELVYTGIGRTPVCSIVKTVPLRHQQCAVAAELFATSADAYLVTGLISEDPNNFDTADSRPLTRPYSLNRLAHMVCCDATDVAESELEDMAMHIVEQQVQCVSAAAVGVLQYLNDSMHQDGGRALSRENPTVILSGSGLVMAERVIHQMGADRFASRLKLPEMFHRPVSESACAFAVARLAHDRCQDDMLEMSLF